MSLAMWEGADNLLVKALRRLADGDDASAMRLIERSCRLPYDQHEDASPAALAARMLLFDTITDEAEGADDDPGWLEPALALLEHIGGQEQVELRACLSAIQNDYALERRDGALIDAALSTVPEGPELCDRGDPPVDELMAAVVGVLRTVLAYTKAVGRLG
ncbi:MAG: hypothetical protein ABJA74_10820 [Lapillicoccus sp.]